MKKFLLRDIFNYTEKEINDLSLIDYELSFHYALETYVRRDVAYVMERIHGGKKGKGKDKGGTTIIIPQPGIEEWVKKQYEDDEEED